MIRNEYPSIFNATKETLMCCNKFTANNEQSIKSSSVYLSLLIEFSEIVTWYSYPCKKVYHLFVCEQHDDPNIFTSFTIHSRVQHINFIDANKIRINIYTSHRYDKETELRSEEIMKDIWTPQIMILQGIFFEYQSSINFKINFFLQR